MTRKKPTKKNPYIPVSSTKGVYKHYKTGRYQATATINGKNVKKTFDSLREARRWRKNPYGSSQEESIRFSSLKEVWEEKQRRHFPTLAKSTQAIWHRRYELWESIEHLPMNKITPSKITSWVEENVEFYRSDFYEGNSRGRAKRCNLDNELNLFTTIFNWYKRCEAFEDESKDLVNPVRTEHKKLGFIRAKHVKEMSISVEDTIKFLSNLKPLYRDLAIVQYLTSSRISEAAGLQWERVELSRNKLTIMETCRWDMSSKVFSELNPHPKNKEPRPMYITPIIKEALEHRLALKEEGCSFVFHVDGKPLNYGTIQSNYRGALRKAGLPHTGTHMLRHGMAKLARRIGGGLDAVIAMTGHKDFKLADHYSKLDQDFQKEIALKIDDHVKGHLFPEEPIEREKPQEAVPESFENVISFAQFAKKRMSN